MQQNQLRNQKSVQMNSHFNGRTITEKLKQSQSDLPIQDAYDEMRRPRSKKYLATVRALRTQYDILEEYKAILEEPVQGETVDLSGNICTPQIRTIEIQQEIELVTAEIKALKERLTQLMPKGDALISLLYMDSNIGTLMSRGVISSEGRAYNSTEELCEYAYSEDERRALILGDVKLHSQPTPLVVEVYLHLVVRVHANGSIETFEV